MLYDTDILIWVQRGNEKAAKLIDRDEFRYLSIQSFMELLQGTRDKTQHRYIKRFIADFGFSLLPLTANIGHRALIYVEEYALSDNICAGDTIIAATAVENGLMLSSF